MNHWLLWRDGTHDPFFNMAMDEILLDHAAALGLPLIRTYRWDRPALSIGCSQRFPAHEAERFTVVRRPTGGGNVYHDADLTYTAVIPHSHQLLELNRMDSYKVFHEAMLPMLEQLGNPAGLQAAETPDVDRATMKCFTAPSRFDVVTDKGDKYAGAAQRRTRNGILHQGSIRLEAAAGDWEKLESALLTALETYFSISFVPAESPAEWTDSATLLATEKYAKEEWNHAARHQ